MTTSPTAIASAPPEPPSPVMTVTIGVRSRLISPIERAIASAIAALLGLGAGMRAGDVDEGHDRQPEPLGELHDPHRLAIALGMRHPEVAPDVLVGVGALLLADDDDPPAVEPRQPGRRSPRRRRTAGRRAARRSRRPSPRRTRGCAGGGGCGPAGPAPRPRRADRRGRAVAAVGRRLGRPVARRSSSPTRSASEVRNDSGRKPARLAVDRRRRALPAAACADGQEPEQRGQLGAQLGARHDPVDEAMARTGTRSAGSPAAAPGRSSRPTRAPRRSRSARSVRRG